ncbi:6-phosphogluconolactonase [Flavihumibacter sp. CACIAM 22H1]|uniref:6-phosphogluconolactonase n=1 Tax=Flavihumibacter sp. CACIAM 22H1 TaxID=1812911 RepID=UPI0007A85A86|nr:6-phosphogluconolactonase [Flavihumibacter sp. CACIAM 22H1]KYP16426.1 MAG: 6-phosphogluconolactonase [Flavihumibacter sp. CACIAM 22H1]
MDIQVFPDAETVAQKAAAFIVKKAQEVLKKQSRFTICLSGGSTPKRLHQLLAEAPLQQQVDWSKVHVFWGDERYVPLEDDRNNARMAYDTLLNKVPIPEEQIHIMRTDYDSPAEAASEYAKLLHQYFDHQPHSFDLLILGMGDDAHTLSLFPHTEVIQENRRWCISFFLEAQDMFRVTITRPVANQSACILFLTTGAGKAKALQNVWEGPQDFSEYPAQSVKSTTGDTIWMVDEAAAALLNQA